MGSEMLYRHTGVVLVRATTDPSGLELPQVKPALGIVGLVQRN